MYLGNHDQPRMLTRWGNDAPAYRDVSSKMLTTFILSIRGTPFYYFGDELGMDNIKFNNISDYNDIEVLTNYQQVKEKGGNLNRFIAGLRGIMAVRHSSGMPARMPVLQVRYPG
jgi:oligo-1,6-glucosidase